MDIINITKSKLRSKILQLYFSHPEKEYYLRELERLLHKPVAYIRQELVKLEKQGLFVSYFRGKQRYFKLNKDFLLYPELKSIVFKTVGIQGMLKKAIKEIKKIKFAFIYGSYARGSEREESDIDLIIVGSPAYSQVLNAVKKIEKKAGRDIDFVIYNEKEFVKKLKDNYFIKNVINSPKLNIIGDIDQYVKEIEKGK